MYHDVRCCSQLIVATEVQGAQPTEAGQHSHSLNMSSNKLQLTETMSVMIKTVRVTKSLFVVLVGSSQFSAENNWTAPSSPLPE